MLDELTDTPINRRNFLSRAIFAIGGFIAGIIGLPAVGYTVSPAVGEKRDSWVDVAAAASVKAGIPQKVDYVVYKNDGWIEEPSAKSCWVLKKEDGQYVVYDPRCTHLGCPYSWHSDKKLFLCPCHNGIFDIEGNVVSGPPPRPLRRYANKVEAGRLWVKEEVINP